MTALGGNDALPAAAGLALRGPTDRRQQDKIYQEEHHNMHRL